MEKSIYKYDEIVPCIWCKPDNTDHCQQCNGVVGMLADMLAERETLTHIVRSQ